RVPPPHTPTLFPYTTLFRSQAAPLDEIGLPARAEEAGEVDLVQVIESLVWIGGGADRRDRLLAEHRGVHERVPVVAVAAVGIERSEEHTSELQSRRDLVCRL